MRNDGPTILARDERGRANVSGTYILTDAIHKLRDGGSLWVGFGASKNAKHQNSETNAE